jgi:hypothetical protein
VEEALEMAGVVLFLHALLAHARAHLGEVRVSIGGRRPGPAASAPVVPLPVAAAGGRRRRR